MLRRHQRVFTAALEMQPGDRAELAELLLRTLDDDARKGAIAATREPLDLEAQSAPVRAAIARGKKCTPLGALHTGQNR
jgi:hypothetical protein